MGSPAWRSLPGFLSKVSQLIAWLETPLQPSSHLLVICSFPFCPLYPSAATIQTQTYQFTCLHIRSWNRIRSDSHRSDASRRLRKVYCIAGLRRTIWSCHGMSYFPRCSILVEALVKPTTYHLSCRTTLFATALRRNHLPTRRLLLRPFGHRRGVLLPRTSLSPTYPMGFSWLPALTYRPDTFWQEKYDGGSTLVWPLLAPAASRCVLHPGAGQWRCGQEPRCSCPY